MMQKNFGATFALLMAIGAVYAPAGADVVSDRFELQWELDGTDLLLAIDTDLPELISQTRRK